MKRNKIAMLTLALILFLNSHKANSINSWIKGELGDARTIITSVVSKYLAQCTVAEARANFASLPAEKKTALVNFLGDEGKAYLLSRCTGDICGFVKSFEPGQPVSEKEFQKLWPEILVYLMNPMPVDKYKKFVDSTADEIGPEGIFMDWQGQEILWSQLDPSRHEPILNLTPDWVFLEIGLRRYSEIKDYTSIYYKQERLDGELQGVETILLKYREKPRGIYMKWLDGPWKGREVLYNENLSKDKVRVRESGLLGVIPVWINYRSPIAMRGTNHPVVEVGLKFMLDLNLREYKKAFANKELARKNHGIQMVDGRRVFVMENIMTRNNPKANYYCHRVKQYMDYERALEPKVEVFNWNDELQESFIYTKLKLNVGLTEKDFDPKNPEYRL